MSQAGFEYSATFNLTSFMTAAGLASRRLEEMHTVLPPAADTNDMCKAPRARCFCCVGHFRHLDLTAVPRMRHLPAILPAWLPPAMTKRRPMAGGAVNPQSGTFARSRDAGATNDMATLDGRTSTLPSFSQSL